MVEVFAIPGLISLIYVGCGIAALCGIAVLCGVAAFIDVCIPGILTERPFLFIFVTIRRKMMMAFHSMVFGASVAAIYLLYRSSSEWNYLG